MSLKNYWKRRAADNLIEWSKERWRSYSKPFALKIDPEKVPALKQAIGRILREASEKPVMTMMICAPIEDIPVPKRNVIFINVSDVQVV